VTRGGGWGRGLVAGTGLEPVEAGGAWSVRCAGNVGRGGQRKERPRARGPLWARWHGPARTNCAPFYLFKLFLKTLELNQLKDGHPVLQKFQIKYVFEAFKIRNNFPYGIF
jgi:hypothetical protein